MNILGLNAYHGDAAACLLRDGQLVAAAEEERFRRVKHWAGFPAEAVRYCLTEAGLALSDVEHVAINSDPRAHRGRKIAYALSGQARPRLVLEKLRTRRRRAGIGALLEAAFPGQSFRGRVHRVEHHRAHLASCFHVSPFDTAVAVSVDGFGDFSSAAFGLGQGHALAVDGFVHFPHSLGVFYQALTQFLGFPAYGDEYKVMGLAAYGEPRFEETLREVLTPLPDGHYRLDLRFFRHHAEPIGYQWEDGAPQVAPLYSAALVELLGPARDADAPVETRHRDLAASVQAVYEAALFNLLAAVHRRYGCDALALAGGCAFNSLANGKITRRTPFRRLYVQAAAGDAGGALGAACDAHGRLAGDGPRFSMTHAYWGPHYSDDAIGSLLAQQASALRTAGCTREHIGDEKALCRRTAEAIAAGRVVGWFQGRMEWGPRALGNRSIVCDPRRADMKDILNVKIKRREPFRPFAPSVLREHTGAWFEVDDDVPFMMKVLPIRAEKRALVPAVTHVDGSGRLQTVTRSANPRYHRLIEAFYELTGVPMVLNTSFNENEPIVCQPTEALACFLRTEMDLLVLGGHVVARMV